ncbi:MAG TPA: lysylphosphatidylglycerol synthase transmembrane domain-containing protein [Chthoniobacteraceae bacterium]|nr:lysylphosphatidylglycerol synthase transmembrane domain-containing protein [Chthoniobacteraceae bacterium]
MKKTVLTIFQVLVTVGILLWLFHDHDKRVNFWNAVIHANLMWVMAGIVAYGIVEVLGATRWMVLLRVQGIDVPWYRLGALLMIGILFNQFMPGGTGGDVVKIFYLLKETPNKKTQALLAVLIDRLIGLVGLIFVAGVVIIWKWNWLTQGKPVPHFDGNIKLWLSQIEPSTMYLYMLLAVLGATVVGIITSFVITGFGLAHKLPPRFPKRDIFVDLSVAYNLYGRAWKATLLSILLSLCVHLCSFTLFYCAAMSINLPMRIPVLEFFAIMPIVNTISALPISVGGAGVREGLFQTMLNTLCGVSMGDALAISLLGWGMVAFWGLVGGVIYLLYKPSEHAKLSDIRREVSGLEHDIAEGK